MPAVAPRSSVEIQVTRFEEAEQVAIFSRLRSIGTWRMPPDLVLCDHPSINLEEVIRAAQWWKDRGYPFGIIEENPHHPACIGMTNWSYLTVTISLPSTGYKFTNYGSTTIYHTMGDILGAQIEVSEPRVRVLEHEIGHALGWLHWNHSDHMMHPRWSSGGWNDTMLNYTEETE